MTCPHCGAYSPKNTSVCNKCGRRLPLLENQQQSSAPDLPGLHEYSGYGYGYRQPQQTKFQLFLEDLGTRLDDIIEDPFSKRAALAIICVPIVIYIILRFCGVCGGCFRCGPACRPEEPVVSATDTVSVGDAYVVSGSGVIPSDAPSDTPGGVPTESP